MLIRYPGSKAKLAAQIRSRLPDWTQGPLYVSGEYREPFFGAGAIGLQVLNRVRHDCTVWLNDKDPGMVALWRAVWKEPGRLCSMVVAFQPTAEAFYDFKRRDGLGEDEVDVGFRKLALHRMSVSGFGAMSGSPIGGRKGNPKYPVDCRWKPAPITRDIKEIHYMLKKFKSLRITCGDFEPLIHEPGENVCIYLDPPYYEKGAQLYKFSMGDDDHKRLAGALRESTSSWVLSYDDHPVVRGLYDWAAIQELSITYTNATGVKTRRPKNKELVITP